MSKRALNKDLFREIKNTRARFLSLFLLVALAVAFLSGLRTTQPDMTKSADDYLDSTNLMDVRIVSNLGLTEEDLSLLAQLEGVSAAQGDWLVDALVSNGESSLVVKTISYTPGGINQPYLLEGRLPEAEDECLVEQSLLDELDLEIGDTLQLDTGSGDTADALSRSSFTVVGTCNSPLYISTQRGTTSLGTGSISAVVYLPRSAYALDYYTDIYLTLQGAMELNAYSDEYKALVDSFTQSIDELAQERALARAESLRSDAQEELDEAQAQLDEARTQAEEELAEAAAELDEARTELDEGWQSYQEGLASLESESADGESQLASAQSELSAAYETLLESEEEYQSGLAQLQEAQEQYEAGLAEYEAGLAEYLDGLAQYEEGLAAYEAGQAEYQSGLAALAEGEEQYQQGLAAYQEGLAEYEEGLAEYQDGLSQYTQAEKAYSAALSLWEKAWAAVESGEAEDSGTAALLLAAREKLDSTADTLAESKAQLEEAEAALAAAAAELEQGEQTLAETREQLDSAALELEQAALTLEESSALLSDTNAALIVAKAELDAAKITLDSAASVLESSQATLEEARSQLDQGWADYESGVDSVTSARRQLKSLLAQANSDLEEALTQLEEGELSYSDGLLSLSTAQEETQSQLEEAQEELDQAQEEIDSIADCVWYVLDRSSNLGFAGYESDAENMGNLAAIFPLIFFLVAALVCLTTMTRMVEEQRSTIGGLKALGYSKGDIARKYVGYGLAASLGGSILGLLLGCTAIPWIIITCWQIMYSIPTVKLALCPLIYLFSAGAAVLVIVVTVLSATLAALRATPATLMRPKTPKSGKRVLLEHIPPLWRRLSFTQKVTVRNLFRYKKRFWMTIIGISGCTALIVTGFGLRDAIDNVLRIQYDQLNLYDATAVFTEENQQELTELLEENSLVQSYALVHQGTMDFESGSSISGYYMVFDDAQSITRLMVFRDRLSGSTVELNDSGVFIGEKLSELLDLQVGDTLVLSGDKRVTATVAGIVENHVYNYVYMTQACYLSLYGETAEHNLALLAYSQAGEESGASVGSALLDAGVISSITQISAMRASLNESFEVINYAVLVVIISAAALAFVVLFNLSNINITERKRELATLKVLGFHNREMRDYVLRENVVLTLLGILLGLFMGKALHAFLVRTVEVEMIMFHRNAEPLSYVLAALLTALFSVIVNVIAGHSLKKIDMVESLKSVE